jgi:glycosyltransferase involved in cell wall biosynthesis
MTSAKDVSAPKKPLRVLIAAPKYINGGHDKQARDLIANLRRDYGVDADLQPVDPLIPRPFRIRYVRTVVKLIYYTVQLLVRVPKYDVVHAYAAGMTSYLLATLPALFVSRLWRRPFLLYYADGRLAEHFASSRIAVPTMRMATVIVGASPYIRVTMAEKGLTARVIPPAINRAIRFRARRNLQPRLITNRLLEPLYNHPCIFRAFARVQQRYPNAELVVGNDGFLRGSLEKLARDMGLRNCRFTGALPMEEVAKTYDEAEIYLSSPNVDCSPASILECFQAGLPVIATRVGGLPYMIDEGRTGLLVNIDDDAAMAECAIRLLETPDLVERMTAAAHAETQQYFWEPVTASWNQLYEETVGAPPGSK